MSMTGSCRRMNKLPVWQKIAARRLWREEFLPSPSSPSSVVNGLSVSLFRFAQSGFRFCFQKLNAQAGWIIDSALRWALLIKTAVAVTGNVLQYLRQFGGANIELSQHLFWRTRFVGGRAG